MDPLANEFILTREAPAGVRLLQASGLLNSEPARIEAMIRKQARWLWFCLLYLVFALVFCPVVLSLWWNEYVASVLGFSWICALFYLPVALLLLSGGGLRRFLVLRYGDGRWARPGTRDRI